MKDSQPSVSIGMPVYNGEPFLKQALDSLLGQDYENFELVISDNASVDATKEICQEYLVRDPRIRYHRNTSNIGPHRNFLKALELSSGKYFMWAAHDDLWDSSFISKLMTAFQNYDDVALACCDYDVIYHLTGKVESHSPLQAKLSAENSIFQNAIWMITFPHSPFFYGIYATNLLKSCRYFTRSEPLDFGDLLLLNEISLVGKVHFVPETLFHAGVKESDARKLVSFAKRRLSGFNFSYGKYYIETMKCIARATRVSSIQKLYLMGLLTNQVLTLISHHEPIPGILKTAIRKELSCSSRVADKLLLTRSPLIGGDLETVESTMQIKKRLISRLRASVAYRLGLVEAGHLGEKVDSGQVGTHNEAARIAWLEGALKQIPAGARILDAGAGERRFETFCGHLDYVAQDFGQYNGSGDQVGLQMGSWDQTKLDIICDITDIPEPNSSFDAIMCVEVFEHLPSPLLALKEFSRLLRSGGHLIITAPFCSLTHFAPYHFYTGFNQYFYKTHLPAYGFEIVELRENGNFFEYLAQEIRRIPSMAELYAKDRPDQLEDAASKITLNMLERLSREGQSSAELLHFGYHVRALKKSG